MLPERVVVLPDIHTPNHNVPAVGAVLKFIKDYEPTTLIQLGDLCDWDSVTSFDPNRESDIKSIKEEQEASCRLLRRIEAVLPKDFKKVLIGGNHEDRVTRWKVKYGSEIQMRRRGPVSDWWEMYKLKEHGWEWLDYGGVYKMGKLLFTHGFGKGGKNMADLLLKRFHKNVIAGHSHRFLTSTWVSFDDHAIMATSIGTLSNFNLSYLRGEPPSDWIHMFATVEFVECGRFTICPVPIVGGKFVRKGKLYGV